MKDMKDQGDHKRVAIQCRVRLWMIKEPPPSAYSCERVAVDVFGIN